MLILCCSYVTMQAQQLKRMLEKVNVFWPCQLTDHSINPDVLARLHWWHLVIALQTSVMWKYSKERNGRLQHSNLQLQTCREDANLKGVQRSCMITSVCRSLAMFKNFFGQMICGLSSTTWRSMVGEKSHSKTSMRGQHILAEGVGEVLCCVGGLERSNGSKGGVEQEVEKEDDEDVRL